MNHQTNMNDILNRILTVKREEICLAQNSTPLEALSERAQQQEKRDFVGALRAKPREGKA
jgi:indole-3-glycerol phosphate synthase